MTDISFIIPHKGRDDMLLQTLASIQALELNGNTIEVIVVSQNTEASDALQAMKATLPLEIVFSQDGQTISKSRNLGVSHAKGRFLAFLDADIDLAPNWLLTMLTTLQREGIVLASAMQVNSAFAPPLERIRTALSNAHLDTTVTFLPGRNLFLKRETFDAVGGFPEHLITCEDYYFTERVAQLGGLYYTSETHYVHIGEDKAFRPMFKKEIWRGQSNLASIKGRKIPLSEWPSFFVPLMPCAFAILTIGSAVMGSFSMAAIALLMTFVPILVYAIRLKWLVREETTLWHCIYFYIAYFPARAIGTINGLWSEISTSSHN
ncbi:glycosyltransferase [Alteromonas sediminis]|uniref:Glycosyltransferase n=1 Tax=Alteromonas sediminis TaxID=2259342 RepID=A0A3N5XXJ2_9ALTE|nr:glycosyltransferase [Alteromonas sediminis]RPJ65717.1 glycosyltransferase [Alteromonas sediminis]